MPTDMPLSARSLGPSPGLLSRASTMEFMAALKAAEAQRSAAGREGASAAGKKSVRCFVCPHHLPASLADML